MEWTKSTHSSNEGPNCVEIATTPGTVRVRDSKHTTGPRLTFGTGVWETFITRATGR
nr:DUF397 domain-containing protein [Streptomyces sp. Z26]